jgi:hypothetical protein
MQHANTEDYATNDYTLWVEEQTGVNLEFVYFSADNAEAMTQLNLMVAGNEELPDVLWYFTGMDMADGKICRFLIGITGFRVADGQQPHLSVFSGFAD